MLRSDTMSRRYGYAGSRTMRKGNAFIWRLFLSHTATWVKLTSRQTMRGNSRAHGNGLANSRWRNATASYPVGLLTLAAVRHRRDALALQPRGDALAVGDSEAVHDA